MNAARVHDSQVCPVHGPGALLTGEPTVLIEQSLASRIADRGLCCAGEVLIASGSDTVIINGKHAARVGDRTCHQGVIETGAATVFIGGRPHTAVHQAYQDGSPFVAV